MRKIVLAFLIIMASVSFGFAASLKISELTETQTLTDDDLFLVSTYSGGSYTSQYIKKNYLVTSLGITNNAATMTVIDTTDASAYVALFDSATGNLAIKTDTKITFDATTGILTATGFAGPITGAVTGNASTATALAANPTDCGENAVATAIDASGNLTCSYSIGTNIQAFNDDLTTLAGGGTAGCIWGEKSDGSGIECKTTLNIRLDDSAAQFNDATDATKTMQLELGSITTGTNRTLTVPDASGTIALVKTEKLAVFNIPGTSDDNTVIDAYVPVASTITGAVITTSGAACSAVVDIWADTYANFPATVADTITASAKPTLSTAQAAKPNISTWTTAIAADSVLRANLDSSDCAGNIQVTIYGTK